MKSYRLFLLFIATLFSCRSDVLNELLEKFEKDASQPLITITQTKNLSSDYLPTPTEHWIVISDMKGEVLAYGELTRDSTFTTQKKIEGNINVTLFSANNGRYKFDTYTEVALNETWIMPDPFSRPNGFANVKAEIEIQDVCLDFNSNRGLNFMASNAQGGVGSSYRYTDLKCRETNRPTTVDVTLSLSEQSPKDVLLIASDGYADPVYRWFSEDVFTTGQTELNFGSDMLPMDHILTYTFSDIELIAMRIMAFDKEDPYYDQSDRSFIHTDFLHKEEEAFYQFKAGYLAGYDQYETLISITKPDKQYSYFKFGSPPEVISEELFDSDFEVLDFNSNTFQFTSTGDFDAAKVFWGTPEPGTAWYIYYPIDKTNNVVLFHFPEEIQTRYPDLSLANLTYRGAAFFDMISKDGYASFLGYIHKNEEGKNVTEHYSVFKSDDD